MSNRPTFYFKENPVRAGGIIFYQKHFDDISYLLIKCDNQKRYEDFGGRTDEVDNDYFDTVARELEEESNGVFKQNKIKDQIINQEPLYNPSGKYVVFFLELTDYINPTIFGNKEYHDNISRTVHWVSHKKITNKNSKNLTFRLLFKPFFKKLKSIAKDIICEESESSDESSDKRYNKSSNKSTYKNKSFYKKKESIEDIFMFR